MAERQKLKTLQPRIAVAGARVQTIKDGSWRTENQSASERGYGRAWQKARIGHLRKHPLCVMCEVEGRVAVATVVDHSIPHRGDQHIFWDSSLWQSLCAHHHSSDKQRQENQGETPTSGPSKG